MHKRVTYAFFSPLSCQTLLTYGVEKTNVEPLYVHEL